MALRDLELRFRLESEMNLGAWEERRDEAATCLGMGHAEMKLRAFTMAKSRVPKSASEIR